MTVKQLIKALSKFPEDATVTVFNRNLYLEGEYKATLVCHCEHYNTVSIDTDYEHEVLV